MCYTSFFFFIAPALCARARARARLHEFSFDLQLFFFFLFFVKRKLTHASLFFVGRLVTRLHFVLIEKIFHKSFRALWSSMIFQTRTSLHICLYSRVSRIFLSIWNFLFSLTSVFLSAIWKFSFCLFTCLVRRMHVKQNSVPAFYFFPTCKRVLKRFETTWRNWRIERKLSNCQIQACPCVFENFPCLASTR